MIYHTSEQVRGATFYYIKIKKEEEVIAYADITIKFRSPQARLSYIFVKEEYRGQGLAKSMLDYIRQEISEDIAVVTEVSDLGKLLFKNQKVSFCK